MRVLITGITGFVGPHLAEFILNNHPETKIWGMAFGDEGREILTTLEPGLSVIEGNLSDPDSLKTVLEQAKPDVVFHLAAASSVGTSWADPTAAFSINVLGQINLFEAALSLGMKPLMIISSSGEIYGDASAGNVAINEDAPLDPRSPYGVSKAAQDLVASQYHLSGQLPTIRMRLFNHTGPRRQANFVASSFAHRIARIEAGLVKPAIDVGNLEVYRDFSDVRDIVRAYWLAASKGEPGVAYNVCSGVAVSIKEVLDHLLALSSAQVEVRLDPHRLRAADIPILVGNHSRFTEATGWSPKIPLEQTLSDLLDWRRLQIAHTRR